MTELSKLLQWALLFVLVSLFLPPVLERWTFLQIAQVCAIPAATLMFCFALGESARIIRDQLKRFPTAKKVGFRAAASVAIAALVAMGPGLHYGLGLIMLITSPGSHVS
jgi:hypothetical protein